MDNPQMPPQGTFVPPMLPKRPTAMSLFGTLHIVFGIFGLLGSLMGLFSSGQSEKIKEQLSASGADVSAVDWDALSAIDKWAPLTNSIGLVIGALLLTAGILLLKSAPLSVKLSNIYCVIAVITVIAQSSITFSYMAEFGNAFANAKPEVEMMFKGILIGSMVMGLLIGLAYPILCFIFLNRKVVKDWIASQSR